MNPGPTNPVQRVQEIAMRKMIEIGSKEEVELLLALFGSRSEPAKKKPRSR